MKQEDADITKTTGKNPVRENKPGSIADGLEQKDKKGYPFPEEKDKQYKDQPEFIDPGSNSSTTDS